MYVIAETEIINATPLGKSRRASSPERSLLLAMVQRAILDLVDKDPKLREEALEWFSYPIPVNGKLPIYDQWGTFYHICLHLEYNDPIGLREEILKQAKSRYIKTTSI